LIISNIALQQDPRRLQSYPDQVPIGWSWGELSSGPGAKIPRAFSDRRDLKGRGGVMSTLQRHGRSRPRRVEKGFRRWLKIVSRLAENAGEIGTEVPEYRSGGNSDGCGGQPVLDGR
jgi:hypothetical protein